MNDTWSIAPGERTTLDLDTVRSLKAALVGGRIDVIGHDEPTARIEVHSVAGKELTVSLTNGHLRVDHPQVDWDNFLDVFRHWEGRARAEVSVLVPREIALKLGVVTADALVSGLHSDARLSTVAGDLTVDATVGDLDVNAVSGEVSVLDHDGSLTAHTVAGSVTATGHLSRVSVDTVGGHLYLDADGVPERVTTNTVGGDLTVRLDRAAARYNIRTLTGTVQIDDTTHHVSRRRGLHLDDGPLTGEWTDFAIRSVSGDVTVLHRDGTASDPAPASDEKVAP